MGTGAAVGMMLQCVLEGSLAMHEIEAERRPYHRNCSCALHNNLKGVVLSTNCSRGRNISFSRNKTCRNDCSLSMVKSQFSSRSSSVVGHSVKSVGSKISMGFSFMDNENISEFRYFNHVNVGLEIVYIVSFLVLFLDSFSV